MCVCTCLWFARQRWEYIQALLRRQGRDSIIRRIKEFDVVHMKASSMNKAEAHLQLCNEKTVRQTSAGAGTFYVWVRTSFRLGLSVLLVGLFASPLLMMHGHVTKHGIVSQFHPPPRSEKHSHKNTKPTTTTPPKDNYNSKSQQQETHAHTHTYTHAHTPSPHTHVYTFTHTHNTHTHTHTHSQAHEVSRVT